MRDQRPCLRAESKELEAAQHNSRLLSVILVSQMLLGFNKREAAEALLSLVPACCSNKLQKPFILLVLKETTTSTCQWTIYPASSYCCMRERR